MRWVIYGIAGLLLLMAAGIAVLAVHVIEGGPNESGGLLGQPTVGGPFELVDGDGKPVTEKDFAGKPMLVYFGYTFCPDVCPTELIAMSDGLDLLSPDEAKQFQPIFVTIDPERDTPEVMKDYVQNFYPTMVGLTGTAEQIRKAAQAYRVYYAKSEAKTEGAPYLMDHSSFIYVMDAKGRYLRHFSMGTTPADIATGLKQVLADL